MYLLHKPNQYVLMSKSNQVMWLRQQRSYDESLKLTCGTLKTVSQVVRYWHNSQSAGIRQAENRWKITAIPLNLTLLHASWLCILLEVISFVVPVKRVNCVQSVPLLSASHLSWKYQLLPFCSYNMKRMETSLSGTTIIMIIKPTYSLLKPLRRYQVINRLLMMGPEWERKEAAALDFLPIYFLK